MTAEIRQREEAFSRLLPEFRIEGAPSTELLATADLWSRAVWATAAAAGPYPLDAAEHSRGLRLAERPVFVCGVHRSGTTLVRDLLDGHLQLSVLPSEGSFLTGLSAQLAALQPAEQIGFLGREWLRRLANPINQVPYWLLGRTTEADSPYVTFARRLQAWWPVTERLIGSQRTLYPLIAVALAYTSCLGDTGIGEETQWWVEKTPTNEFYLDRLWAALPAAKVIHVVRDPAAVYASRKRLEERSIGAFRNARQVLEELRRSLRIAVENSARGHSQTYHLVRYEELIAAPEAVTGGIAAFLGIEPHASLLSPTVAGRPTYANSSFSQSGAAGSILAAASENPGAMLADSEREWIAAYTGDYAAALGYPVPALSARQKQLLKMKLRLWRGKRG